MNTNVGEMPLDIFSDYISDILEEEWCWEYLIPLSNWQGYVLRSGDYYNMWFGNGHGFNNAEIGLGWFGVEVSYGDGLSSCFGDETYTGNGYCHNPYEY
jgi:hypothetical protein